MFDYFFQIRDAYEPYSGDEFVLYEIQEDSTTLAPLSLDESPNPIVRRGFLFVEDMDWEKATSYFEKALDENPEDAYSYLGCALVDYCICDIDSLLQQPDIENNRNYKRVLRFAQPEMVGLIQNRRNSYVKLQEKNKKVAQFNDAVHVANSAKSVEVLERAANLFQNIDDSEAALDYSKKCKDRALILQKNLIYEEAYSTACECTYNNTLSGLDSAIEQLATIPNWRNADKIADICRKELQYLQKEEETRQRTKKENEEKRIAEYKKRKLEEWEEEEKGRKKKARLKIIIKCSLAAIAIIGILVCILVSKLKYEKAVRLYNAGQYEEAADLFESAWSYKDSKTYLKEIAYQSAVDLFNSGNYADSITKFQALGSYKSSQAYLQAAQQVESYYSAISLYEAGKYEAAISIFESLGDYKDSASYLTSPASIEIVYDKQALNVGDTMYLSVSIVPSTASSSKISWKSSNKTVVTVDANGKVKAVNAGKSTITATGTNGKSASLLITVNPKPVSVSNGFILRPRNGDCIAPVKINAPYTESVYVYFKCTDKIGRDFSVFVRAGTSCEVDVPTGTYTCYYATGTTWYGSEYKFGADTEYFKADDTFRFYILGDYCYGTELTLYATYYGNLDTTGIKESEFPG